MFNLFIIEKHTCMSMKEYFSEVTRIKTKNKERSKEIEVSRCESTLFRVKVKLCSPIRIAREKKLMLCAIRL